MLGVVDYLTVRSVSRNPLRPIPTAHSLCPPLRYMPRRKSGALSLSLLLSCPRGNREARGYRFDSLPDTWRERIAEDEASDL
jgi:hypothetical protein